MYFLADNKIGEAGAASLIVGLFESQAIVKLNLESGEQINRMEKECASSLLHLQDARLEMQKQCCWVEC